eukprot:263004_1
MTEPLKPRIDFDGPLEVDQNPKFRAQQTFDENQAQNFAPATLDEAQEEEGQVEAVMDAALRPKRSLWRKMVMGGLARCKAMGIEAGKVLRLGDMARSDNVIFSATGITKGDLLEGISRKGNIATTETLLIRGKSRTIRRIQSIHSLDRKDPEMQVHIL